MNKPITKGELIISLDYKGSQSNPRANTPGRHKFDLDKLRKKMEVKDVFHKLVNE
jgi:hypothetical protein